MPYLDGDVFADSISGDIFINTQSVMSKLLQVQFKTRGE